MPYLIEKSCGTRTQVEMTADEARFRAQSARVIEIHADGTVIGDVLAEGATAHEDTAHALDAAFTAIDEAGVVEQLEAEAAQEFHADQAEEVAAPKKPAAKKTAAKAKK